MEKTTLMHLFAALQAANRLNTARVSYDLAADLRAHHVTIRVLAAHMGVTLKRIREVRAMGVVPYLVALDYQEAIATIAASSAS